MSIYLWFRSFETPSNYRSREQYDEITNKARATPRLSHLVHVNGIQLSLKNIMLKDHDLELGPSSNMALPSLWGIPFKYLS